MCNKILLEICSVFVIFSKTIIRIVVILVDGVAISSGTFILMIHTDMLLLVLIVTYKPNSL